MINQITDLFSPLFWIINSPLSSNQQWRLCWDWTCFSNWYFDGRFGREKDGGSKWISRRSNFHFAIWKVQSKMDTDWNGGSGSTKPPNRRLMFISLRRRGDFQPDDATGSNGFGAEIESKNTKFQLYDCLNPNPKGSLMCCRRAHFYQF